MSCGTPEIENLFIGDFVVILDEKWEGEEPSKRRKFKVRTIEDRGVVEGWVNEGAVKIIDEILW
jgi:hypothetical protein